ncbi:MAG: thermonuclease family protein [Thermomicrobium sp.]|nr:thermonuclease family protein [Thermomicrobium sp.]MDW8059293.1 thermonuclease family protein [Thermomicrobium sp.]
MRRLLLLALLWLAAACSSAAPPQPPTAQPPAPSADRPVPARPAPTPPPPARPTPPLPAVSGERATVRTVIDGDTLTVLNARGEFVVRLIGIDAPERGDERRPPECYHEEATRILADLAPPGSVVFLERDVSETDRYGRLLRYVWVERAGRWILVNEELVRRGAAVAREYPPDTRYAGRLAAAERVARSVGEGLWGACTGAPATVPAPPPSPSSAGCDPSYPDICVPPPPPDLDCRDIPVRRFRVLPTDPHWFDTDRDGVGCESG